MMGLFMKVIDISRVIGNGSVVWKGSAPLQHERVSDIGEESLYRETRLGGWTTHLLTHLDAPAHIMKDGLTLDRLPLERFTGKALVREVHGNVADATCIPPESELCGKALFIKTRNSLIETEAPFVSDYVFLTPEAAALCVARGATMVGIDYYSVDTFDSPNLAVHHILLGNDVLVLEALQLKNVAPGLYNYAAFPLKIRDADGSPVRAVLMTD